MAEKEVKKKRKKKKVTDNDAIVLDRVTMIYDNANGPALDNVSLRVKKGEFVFVVGDSGSGKSTLIKLLLREEKATEGNVHVLGYDLNRIRHRRIPQFRRNIGIVFQDFRLLNDRNVYENVAFAQRIIQTPVKLMKRNVPAVLTSVGLAGKYRMRPKHLSGGEQQRVALARALVNEPTLLLCDEPTGNLDPKTSREIMKMLLDINEKGTTVIVVTHDSGIVDTMQKRVVRLKMGNIISDEEEGAYINED